MPYASNVVISDRLSSVARDRIFQLLFKTAKSQITIPSFPSAEYIDKLIKVGIVKRTESDAWIHPYTFESAKSRPEYLTALVAAGCICFGVPSVHRTGVALQEIVRVALNNLVGACDALESGWQVTADALAGRNRQQCDTRA